MVLERSGSHGSAKGHGVFHRSSMRLWRPHVCQDVVVSRRSNMQLDEPVLVRCHNNPCISGTMCPLESGVVYLRGEELLVSGGSASNRRD